MIDTDKLAFDKLLEYARFSGMVAGSVYGVEQKLWSAEQAITNIRAYHMALENKLAKLKAEQAVPA